MEIMTQDERTLTQRDFSRLEKLVQLVQRDTGKLDSSALESVLDMAECVPSREVGPDVVTMGSRVLLIDMDSDQTLEVQVCYPPEADPAEGLVSVLSPVGAALLGRRVGEVARWRMIDGGRRGARVAALLFQPEASGHYDV